MYKLMIVDDEPLVIKAIEHIIEKQFNNIKIVSYTGNGLNAIKLAKESNPDIILMDIELDGINGIDSTNEINRFLPETIIIIISAYDNFNYAQQAIKLNVLDYILKPVTRSDIVQIINKAINKIEKINKETMEKLLLKEKLANNKNFNYQFNPPWDLEKELFQAFETNNLKQIKISHEKLFQYISRKSSLSEARKYYQELIAVIIRLVYELLVKEGSSEEINLRKYQNNLKQTYSFEELKHLFMENLYSIHKLNTNFLNNEINPLLLKARQYIEKNYRDDISLDKIAEHICISPTYLSKLFKDTFNITIINYITKIRISHAIELLKDTQLSIKTISRKCGYHDPNYFSKVFKKITGNSPSSFPG